MYLKFEILEGTITLNGTIAGSRGDWTVRVTAPGGVVTEDRTTERTWHALFTEMTAAAFKSAHRRRFPDRTAVAVDGVKA
jgi:hypothetical protein